jgi:hypothetical protein
VGGRANWLIFLVVGAAPLLFFDRRSALLPYWTLDFSYFVLFPAL